MAVPASSAADAEVASAAQVTAAPAPVPEVPTKSVGEAVAPAFAPETPIEPVTDLPASPAPQIDAITLFPNQGELTPTSGFNDQRFGYVLHGSAKVSYESNIFIQPENALKDVIFRFSPGVAVGWGDFKGEVRGSSKFGDLFEHYLGKSYIFADYRPSWSVFLDHADENSFNHDLAMSGEWLLQKLSLGARARYYTENAPDEDLGNRRKQARISAALTTQYDYSGKTSFEVNGYVDTRTYDGQGDDSKEWRNEDWLNYQLLPKINVSLGTTFGYIEREVGSSEHFQQALLRVRYKATQNFTFGFSAGPQFRQTEDVDDQTDGVFAVSAAWTPVVDTYLALQANRRTVPSGTRGQSYTNTGVQLQYRDLIFQHFYFGLLAGYRHADYNGILGATDYGREDDLYFVRPSLGFILTEWMNCELGGEYRSNHSNNLRRNFNATTFSAQFNVLF
jgi:hypothetical protein